MTRRYAISVERHFNFFGAWIATDVILYRLSKKVRLSYGNQYTVGPMIHLLKVNPSR